MQRVSERNIFLRNNNCTTECQRRDVTDATDDFLIFLSSRTLFLKIMSLMNVHYFRYLVLAGNFLNFQLCEIQLGADASWINMGPVISIKVFPCHINAYSTPEVMRIKDNDHSL